MGQLDRSLPDNVTLDVAGKDAEWVGQLPAIEMRLTSAISAIWDVVPMARELSKRRLVEISVLLTHDDQMQELNREYRGKDKPTNVLSFPGLTSEELSIEGHAGPGMPCIVLGDVAISLETITEEAQAAEKKLADHLSHLIVHGLLHLLGYDHEDEEDARIMEGLEVRILAHLSIDDPYTT